MKRLGLTGLAVTLLLALIFATTASAQEDVQPLQPLTPPLTAENGQMTNESTNLWFVELKGKPTADGGKVADLQAEQDAFRANAAKMGINLTVRMAFHDLWN